MAITIISFILVLGFLVFWHEFGHYWVARRNGIVVEEFGMGYPPRLVKLFTYDGTAFTLNLIPFGGFARMKGEDAGDMSPGSFNSASRGARAATLAAGPIMNALLAVGLFAASFMAGFPAMVGTPQLTDISTNELAQSVGLQSEDMLLRINGEPVMVNPVPEIEFPISNTPEAAGGSGSILTISRQGTLLDLPLPDEGTLDEILSTAPFVPVMMTQITETAPDSPASEAGLQPKDLVYAVDDSVVTYENQLSDIIDRHSGEEVTLTLLRDGQWTTLNITPRVDPPEGEGALGVRIAPVTTLTTLPFLQSLWRGVVSTTEYVLLVVQLPVMLLMGQLSPSETELTGPVGIAQMVGGAMSATLETRLWFPILRLSAILSAALAITNMLPLPALDGGRLMFILFETIRGRRVNPEREGLIHMVGFVLLLGLIALITVRDISTTREGIDWITILGQ